MNNRLKNIGAGCVLILAIFAIVPAFFLFCHVIQQDDRFPSENGRQPGSQTAAQTSSTENSAILANLPLYSRNAILIRLDNNAVLLEKNSDERIYPASLTKIMTAIVAIEHIRDLQTKITLSPSIFKELSRLDASLAGFEPGETAAAGDLLYGILLPSGAECCIGLANAISGSEQDFAELMNEKATELHMTGTHFVNTTGLHDENHYTTVQDLAVLLRYALKNQTFRAVFTSSRHTVSATNKHPGGFTLRNTMFERLKTPAINGGAILGGKTGYTEQAGLCLASLAKENGKEYILVTAGANGNHDTEQYNITDALEVFSVLHE